MAKLTKAQWREQQEDAIKFDAWQVGLVRQQLEDLKAQSSTDNTPELTAKIVKFTLALEKAEIRHAKFKAEVESWWNA